MSNGVRCSCWKNRTIKRALSIGETISVAGGMSEVGSLN